MFRFRCLLSLLSFSLFCSHVLSADLKSLTPVDDVKNSLVDIFGDADVDVQRIGVSELFLAKSPNETFAVDARGMALLKSTSIRYVSQGLIKVMHYGNVKQHTLSNFYHYANSGLFPKYGSISEEAQPIVVFMDPKCPNCEAFHRSGIAKLAREGFSFIYIPSLRNIDDKRTRAALISAYCSTGDNQFNRVQALYSDFRNNRYNPIDSRDCIPFLEDVIDSTIDTFVRQKMLGSPAFMLPDGEIIYGEKAITRRLLKKKNNKRTK